MKIKTQDLIGAALDWAVWAASGGAAAYPKTTSGPAFLKLWRSNTTKYVHPSTDWAQGGPIIEREHIALDYYHTPIHPDVQPRWEARHGSGVFEYGPTPLIAAMRAYVASKLGDEVEVPEELV